MIAKVNIEEKFSLFDTHWDPKIVGALNRQFVKLAKFKGEFIWHKHDREDEMFLVVRGTFDMHLRDGVITVNEGEFIIIPRGTEHKPVARDEVSVLLFEPETTINTDDAPGELTQKDSTGI